MIQQHKRYDRQGPDNTPLTRAYKRWLLALLTGILMFNFVDRFALGVVLEQIKRDLQLSDTELGFLTGLAFALFYSVMGIPIARWADRGNRVTIISLATALWSIAVACCGAAGSFLQLLLVRMSVAVGEAGGFPPSLSLISDYFDRAERPRAMSIYTLGAPLSAITGYFLAGWLSERYGWRGMFVWIGLPGVIAAVIAWSFLKEPRRMPATDASRPAADGMAEPATLSQVCATLWANVTFRHLLLCNSIAFFFIYGITQWQPTFFIRSYGLSNSQIGTLFAAVYGLGGLIGTCLGGLFVSRFASRNERLQLASIAVALLGSGLLGCGIYLGGSPYTAFSLLGLAAILQYSINGPLYAVLQTVVPPNMRAVSVALVMFFANLIGMGLGPLATGALSDAYHRWAAEESLRYGLLTLCPGYFWAAWHAWRASRTVTQQLAAQDAATSESLAGASAVGAGRFDPDTRLQDVPESL
jgi:predicted MFS family arabinose efflux permease